MNQYDHIEEVEKNIDEIEVVEKFNPFHDAQGKFSSSNGFKTYSANPNTRAGAMAIARSAAAGHGNTMNVHSQSYGENIRQNANWLGNGKMLGGRRSGYQFMRNNVESASGVPGASRVGGLWYAQNQRQGRTTKPGKQTPTNQQPKQQPQQQAQQQTKPTQAKPAAQKPAQAKPAQPDRQPVDGTDLVAKLGKAKVKNMTIDEILEAQGMNGKGKIAKTDAEIASAIKNGMNIGVRSWNGADAATRAAYDDQLKNGSFYTKCSGGNALGRGMYVAVSTPANQQLKASGNGRISKGSIDYGSAMRESQPYGDWHVNMVIDKSAKLVTLRDARNMARKDGFNSSSWAKSDTVDEDIGAYIAAKGYDGVIWNGKTGTLADNPNLRGEYVNMVNRTKVTIIDRSGDRSAGDLRATTNVTGKWGAINPNSL